MWFLSMHSVMYQIGVVGMCDGPFLINSDSLSEKLHCKLGFLFLYGQSWNFQSASGILNLRPLGSLDRDKLGYWRNCVQISRSLPIYAQAISHLCVYQPLSCWICFKNDTIHLHAVDPNPHGNFFCRFGWDQLLIYVLGHDDILWTWE